MTYQQAEQSCRELADKFPAFPHVVEYFRGAANLIHYARESAERASNSCLNTNGRKALGTALDLIWKAGSVLSAVRMDVAERIALVGFLNGATTCTEVNIEVDEDNKEVGLRPRNDFYTGKYIHRSVHLIVANKKGDVFLTKRADDKKWYPGMVTFAVSGTVGTESRDECIVRETEEEIGLEIRIGEAKDKKGQERFEARPLYEYLVLDEDMKSWSAIYFLETDEPPKADPREVSSAYWVSREELAKLLRTCPEIFTPPARTGLHNFLEQ